MTPAERARLESLAIRYGEAYAIAPGTIRHMNDQQLTDLVRSFTIIAEHKRKIAQLASGQWR